jgi:hypothetical protein
MNVPSRDDIVGCGYALATALGAVFCVLLIIWTIWALRS